tara:strand:- start:235 stop:1113 length:879 start_codon:yes stop_codon:yes gene_type:complete
MDTKNNGFIDYSINDPGEYMGRTPEIEKFTSLFPMQQNTGTTIYIDRISVSINGHFEYDTYIRANKTITEKMVKKYVESLSKDYKVEDIKYVYQGGPPMANSFIDIKEVEGNNVWVVNLKPDLYIYMNNRNGLDTYTQYGGNFFATEKDIFDYLDEQKRTQIKGKKNIFAVILDTLNELFFFIDEKPNKCEIDDKRDKRYFEDVREVNTKFNGKEYYTYLNIYKDGKYLHNIKVSSFSYPIEWSNVLNEILKLNNDTDMYGYVYRLTNTWNEGFVLETTKDVRYKVNYNCKK